MSSYVRAKVSKSKRRYVDKKNGFDLDLSYITKQIIAMGFPSEGMEAKYRNPYSEVIRFLDLEHPHSYKVYNLCSERGYDPAKFYDRVALFPFDDHNAPPFELIEDFCNDVNQYLSESSKNVAVIHCKAGKGRTGTMICSYLLYVNEWDNTEDSMDFYAAMRTYNKKGVTIPSQIRYIRYFEQYLKYGMPESKTLLVNQIIFHGCPKFQGELRLNIIQGKTKNILHSYKKIKEKKKKKGEDDFDDLIFICNNVEIQGDIKFDVTDKKSGSSVIPVCSFWLNTAFVASRFSKNKPTNVLLDQIEVDKVNKDKNHKVVPKGFQLEIVFNLPDGEVLGDGISLGESSQINNDQQQDESDVNYGYSDILERYPSLNNI